MKSCRFGVLALAFLLLTGFSTSVYAQAQGNRQGRQRATSSSNRDNKGSSGAISAFVTCIIFNQYLSVNYRAAGG